MIHGRTVSSCYGHQSLKWIRNNIDPKACRIKDSGKHKYLMVLDPVLKKKLELLRKPYPKRAESKAIVAPADQAGEGGVTPTSALHMSPVGTTASQGEKIYWNGVVNG